MTESVKSKPEIIVIVGTTASGKSELAVKLAKRINGEIISADSRQVYKGLNIGSGKVSGKWRPINLPTGKRPLAGWKIFKRKIFVYKGIPHHCIDFVPPQKVFTAADFKKCAGEAIADITERGKRAIVAGGTGFYVDALVYDFGLPEVRPVQKLRARLMRKSAGELFAALKKLDPARAKSIDSKNPRRLIRAIEIAKALGRVPKCNQARTNADTEQPQTNANLSKIPYKALWLGLAPAEGKLRKNIDMRAAKMIKAGFIREVRTLLKRKVPRTRILEFGFEYSSALDFIDGRISERELRQRIVSGTVKYAKRQRTWFKRNPDIRWIRDKREELRTLADWTRTNADFPR